MERITVKCLDHGRGLNPHSDDSAIRTQMQCTKPLGHGTPLWLFFLFHQCSVTVLYSLQCKLILAGGKTINSYRLWFMKLPFWFPNTHVYGNQTETHVQNRLVPVLLLWQSGIQTHMEILWLLWVCWCLQWHAKACCVSHVLNFVSEHGPIQISIFRVMNA